MGVEKVADGRHLLKPEDAVEVSETQRQVPIRHIGVQLWHRQAIVF